jgi:erythromycin esterase
MPSKPQTTSDNNSLAQKIREISTPLKTIVDLDPIMDLIGDSRLVLLGEASHGTSEYYLWRARLTQRLIQEKGFTLIAVEGDWPDCYQVNRYIKGYPEAATNGIEALQVFRRWPTWMWANWEIAALVEWLRRHNGQANQKTGFYGLDVYSLWESMESIVAYLEKTDPEAARVARQAYLCFEPFGESEQAYAWNTRMVAEDCEDEVIDLLLEMQRRAVRYDSDPEAAFNAEQNAHVMVNAERYYRAMVRSDMNSWNVRDIHMADTLGRLLDFHGPDAKAVVWAHNTHIGDARATDMVRAGMVNLGQLARERHSDLGVVLVGFGTHRGSVIAGREWGAPLERMEVPEARLTSWEALLHDTLETDHLLLLHQVEKDVNFLKSRGHRAIGVVYDPDYESRSNYVPTVLPLRYDSLIYLDETRALYPMNIEEEPGKQPPETYPWGM